MGATIQDGDTREKRDRLESKIMNSIYFYFFLLFYLFSYLELKVEVCVTSYMTVTNCHMSHKNIEDFE